MGTIFLIIAFILELAAVIYSLITKSYQEKIRTIVHITILAVFSILATVSVIQWSFRWYGLVTLLSIWTAIGIFKLFKPDGKREAYRLSSIALKGTTAMLLMLITAIPALVFPEYKLPEATGSYAVTTAQYTYIDASRIEEYANTGENRKVNVEFWYPESGNGVYPLIVFSHGGLGLKSSNVSLYTELASHGYVVCSLDHPYQSFWTKDEDGRVSVVSTAYFMELQRENARLNKQQSFEYYQEWMSLRTSDMNFVIDIILRNVANGAKGVYSLIDPEKMGVMGHSLGGSAALGIPRQRDDVDAVIALESPFLFDIVGVENDEFVFMDQIYPVPVLNIYSDSAWENFRSWPQYARNTALLSDPQAAAFNVHLSGAGHFSLTDLSLASPLLVRMLEGGESEIDSTVYLTAVNKACLQFFNRYLKNQGEFTG